MRLFIAINFREDEKDSIENIIRKVEKESIQGRFVKREHMHLTLEFLGEVPEEKVPIIKTIIEQITFEPFIMKLSSLGSFKRRDGDIYWLGIENNEVLFEIQRVLHNSLVKEGFKLEDRPYKPHITLGRKVKMNRDFDAKILDKEIREMKIWVEKIDLVKSEFRDDGLVYNII